MAEIEYSVYFVPVPIGNRADVTLRALDVLRKVDVIACEDTRHSGLLLSHYEIRKPLLSMHDHQRAARAPRKSLPAPRAERALPSSVTRACRV